MKQAGGFARSHWTVAGPMKGAIGTGCRYMRAGAGKGKEVRESAALQVPGTTCRSHGSAVSGWWRYLGRWAAEHRRARYCIRGGHSGAAAKLRGASPASQALASCKEPGTGTCTSRGGCRTARMAHMEVPNTSAGFRVKRVPIRTLVAAGDILAVQ